MHTLERAERILDDVTERVLGEIPAGAVLFDAHTHLGDDIDGMRGRLVDGNGELAFETEDDLGPVETLGDHVPARQSLEDRRLSV